MESYCNVTTGVAVDFNEWERSASLHNDESKRIYKSYELSRYFFGGTRIQEFM